MTSTTWLYVILLQYLPTPPAVQTGLRRAIYDAVASGRDRMQILIPHEEYEKASRLYGKAEIHDSVGTEEGLWMDVSLPNDLKVKYEHYSRPRC